MRLINADELPLDIEYTDIENAPSVDAIPRQYVLDLLENPKRVRKEIINRIYEYPSIYPKSDKPSGKWISHGEHCKQLGVMPSGLGSYWWCSNCETGIESTQFHRVEYNYCPNCGAKMESEDKE